jgi:hypothetical protein
MPTIIGSVSYSEEGVTILEDEVGKFLVSKDSPDIIPLYDNKSIRVIDAWMHRFPPIPKCRLVQPATLH